jgi:hypothetical protein
MRCHSVAVHEGARQVRRSDPDSLSEAFGAGMSVLGRPLARVRVRGEMEDVLDRVVLLFCKAVNLQASSTPGVHPLRALPGSPGQPLGLQIIRRGVVLEMQRQLQAAPDRVEKAKRMLARAAALLGALLSDQDPSLGSAWKLQGALHAAQREYAPALEALERARLIAERNFGA